MDKAELAQCPSEGMHILSLTLALSDSQAHD